MRTRYGVLAALTALFWLVISGCAAPTAAIADPPAGSPSAIHPLTTIQPHRVAGYGQFTLSRITTAARIRASQGEPLLQAADGQIFIDILLTYTNQSAQTLPCDQLLSVQAVCANGTVYSQALYCVENDARTRLTPSAKVPHLATVPLHCILSVPQSERAVTLLLSVQGQVFSRAYRLGETVGFPAAHAGHAGGPAQCAGPPVYSTT